MDITSIQRTCEGYYHNGYFLIGEDELYNVDNPKWDFSDEQDQMPGFAYDNAHVFKMGSCQLFSLALKQEFGYSAVEVKGQDGRLIHAFCMGEICQQKAFVDVRGITTNWNEFWSGFMVRSGEEIHMETQDLRLDQLNEDEAFGYRFACWIIEHKRELYQL